MPLRLVRPAAEHLPGYRDAMARGFLPSNVDGERVRARQQAAIAADAADFLDRLHDPDARGAPIRLPDGSEVPRLPGWCRWNAGRVDPWLGAAAILAAAAGTVLARRVVEAMSDATFRRWGTRIITAIGVFYLAQGAWMLGTSP